MRLTAREDLTEHEYQDAQHDKGIEQGPENPQRHVPIPDFEVLPDEVIQ
jgi:hypothetical protein